MTASVSLAGHCHEKNEGGNHSKQKYFDAQEPKIETVEGNLDAIPRDDSADLVYSSARDSSSLTLGSK